MKCLILAAGYATRLFPLTENYPKPLLKVGEKSILDWLIEDIHTAGLVDEYVVISNHRFAPHFEACDKLSLEDDLLIIAGDNVLDFSLTSFLRYAQEKGTSCTMRYYEAEEARLRKSGVSEIDENQRLLSMEEKPETPKSNWCTPPFYFYKKADVARIKDAIADGCGIDAPGSLLSWMCRHSTMHSMEMPGSRYDIGNLESYRRVQETYKGITK